MNERDFPRLVELELPPGGLPSQNLEFDAFHREHGIPIRRGRGRHEAEQFHVRFCFPDTATADAFHQRFGGTRLTYSPFKPGRPTGPRARYQPSYSPRVVDGKPADLRLEDELRVIRQQLTRLVFRAQSLPRAASSPKNRSARHRAAVSPS
jgi:hypothetical protein